MQEKDYQRLLAAVIKSARHAVNANNAKSEFISNLSYELRTTLTNIIGMAQLLSMDCLLPTQQRCVTDILEAVDAILPLVNRLLNLSQLEAQHTELQASAFNLKTLLEKVVNQLLYQAGVRRLQLLLDYPETIPVAWIGYPDLIYHIILNLTSNALINTEHGTVIVQVDCLAKEFGESPTEILLSVKDTGKGMEKAELIELQACFSQLNKGDARSYKVFNLGLAITLGYVRLLKASLEVESISGKGSQFTCHIPLKVLRKTLQESSLEQKKVFVRSNLNTLRILLIEDNVTIQRIYSLMLKKIGLFFNIASNAEMALAYYMQHHYDLILMDIALPDSNGMAITQIIRQQETHGEHIPIIALTAYGQTSDQQRFLKAGIDEVLIKPIKLEEINYLLDKWVKSKTVSA